MEARAPKGRATDPAWRTRRHCGGLGRRPPAPQLLLLLLCLPLPLQPPTDKASPTNDRKKMGKIASSSPISGLCQMGVLCIVRNILLRIIFSPV